MTNPDVQPLALRNGPQRPALNEQDLDSVEKAGWGLSALSEVHRRGLQVLARHWGLDVGMDIEFNFGQPYIKDNGWQKIMRRHPEFAGYRARPLIGAEKAAWGFADDDLAIEAIITTRNYGEVAARGRVTLEERTPPKDKKASLPIQAHPVDMAEKRARDKAIKLAFGREVPTEEDWQRAMASAGAEVQAETAAAISPAQQYERMAGSWFADEFPSPSPRYVDRTGQPVAGLEPQVEAEAAIEAEIVAEAESIGEAAAAIHQAESTAFDDVSEVEQRAAPAIEDASEDEVLAWLAWVNNKMAERQDRMMRAGRAQQMTVGTVISKAIGGVSTEEARALGRYVLRMLTKRTDALPMLGYGECEVILELAGQENTPTWADWETRVAQVASRMPKPKA